MNKKLMGKNVHCFFVKANWIIKFWQYNIILFLKIKANLEVEYTGKCELSNKGGILLGFEIYFYCIKYKTCSQLAIIILKYSNTTSNFLRHCTINFKSKSLGIIRYESRLNGKIWNLFSKYRFCRKRVYFS